MTSPKKSSANELNMLFVNSSGLPDDQVLITFQDPSQTLDVSYKKASVKTKIDRVAKGDVMTQTLNLKEIGSSGLQIANAQGPVVFVSFAATASKGGFTMDGTLSGNAEPSYIGTGGANYLKSYQPFEITYVKNATEGQGNLTNINYFAAPLLLQSYQGGTAGSLLQTRGYYKGTATGTMKLIKALSALTAGDASAKASNEGNNLRYIGPSSYGAGSNPYPTFNDYLDALHKAGQITKIQNQNAFNTMAVPDCHQVKSGKKEKMVCNFNYDYVLDFTATVAANRTITIAGTINTTITEFGKAPKAGKSYTGMSMTISPTIGADTSEAIFTNTIYGQADPLGSGKGSTTFNSVWDTLEADMKALGLILNENDPSGTVTTYMTTQSLTIGEITTGLLGGFLGSDVLYSGGEGEYSQYNGQKYKDVPSQAWWNSSTIPSPSTLQPKHTYYSAYSQIIFDATDNEVYSIPFSDRFGKGPLMQTQLYDGNVVDTWVVTIGKPLWAIERA